MRARRIAILWPSGHLDRCPPAINLAILLARKGFEVDLFGAQNVTAAIPAINEPNVTMHFHPVVQHEFREPVASMTLAILFNVRTVMRF